MKYVRFVVLLILCISLIGFEAYGSVSGFEEVILKKINLSEMYSCISFLSSTTCYGRLSGSMGERASANYVSNFYDEIGLKKLDFLGLSTYQQYFSLKGNAKCIIRLGEKGSKIFEFEAAVDGRTKVDSVSGKFVFAGYGITYPGKWDDYGGRMLLEKEVVFVLDSGPRGDPSLIPKDPYWSLAYKVQNAYEHGASAIVVVGNPLRNPLHTPITDIGLRLISFNPPIPVFSISTDDFEGLMRYCGEVLVDLQFKMDGKFEPTGPLSYPMYVVLTAEEIRSQNIVGYIPSNLGESYVVLKARLDHTGTKKDFFYPGADSASGVACLLEIAKALVESGFHPSKNIIFLVCSGEIQGSTGSLAFIEEVKRKNFLKKIEMLIEVEMIGVGPSEKVVVEGADTKKAENREKISSVISGIKLVAAELNIDVLSQWSRSSGFYLFGEKGIPSVRILSGGSVLQHQELLYSSKDTLEKIKGDTLKRVSNLLVLYLSRLLFKGKRYLVESLYRGTIFFGSGAAGSDEDTSYLISSFFLGKEVLKDSQFSKLKPYGKIFIVGGTFSNTLFLELSIPSKYGVEFRRKGKNIVLKHQFWAKYDEYVFTPQMWRKEDYGAVIIDLLSDKKVVCVAGCTRYGTRAAALHLIHDCNVFKKLVAIVHWQDSNGNGVVERGEVELVKRIVEG